MPMAKVEKPWRGLLIQFTVIFSHVKAPLEKLTNKLRSLNGDIKDPRAAFMNRTKVK